MARYIKKTTIVEAFQAGPISNWGELGNLTSTDFIIILADNTFRTMDKDSFEQLYEPTSEMAPLTGTIDWA